MFQLTLIAFNGVMRALFAKYLIKTSHLKRMVVVSVIMMISFALLAFCCIYKENENLFYLALLASLLQGSACSIGEITVLGFLKSFPRHLVGHFSSGTGMAGIFGSGILIVLKALQIQDGVIYGCGMPTVLCLLGAFYWLDRQK